jgi:plastocyanin
VRYLFSLPLAVLLVAAACNGAAQPPADPVDPGPGEPAPATEVSIIDNAFDPATLSISAGDTVTWTNTGDLPHTVTFEEGPDSGTLSSGQTFQHTFDSMGTFTYICTIHPTMQGVVNVDP